MDVFEKFYNKALRFLSYRPRSEKEIRDKLKSKKVDLSIVEQIVQKLKEQNFINDEEFARWWVEQRTTFKPRSLKLIKIELRQKGLTADLIDKTIYDLRFKNYDDLELARKLVEKRIKRYRNLSTEEIYQKVGRFLAQKGFNWEVIKQSIDGVLKG